MIEEKLEIILITYNRYKDLNNTLKDFLNSPFSDCKITILDNCSDDRTPEICAEYQKLFTNMIIVKHLKNIGANPNILRAVETSRSLYTWIICDDDTFDFSDCLDILDAINSEKFDLISPGSKGEKKWERGLSTTVKNLIERGSSYFIARSFLPGNIFKTELFDSTCVSQGYANSHNLFPHFPFVNKSFDDDFSIYLSKNNIIQVGTHNKPSFSNVYFIVGWINSCSLIRDKNIRKNAVYSLVEGDGSLILRIFYTIIWDKMMKEKEFSKNILSLIFAIISTFGYSKEVLLIFLILPVSIMPRSILKSFLKLYKNKSSDWNYFFSDKNNEM